MSSIVEDFGQPYLVHRYTAGSRLNGSWVPGAEAAGWPKSLILSIQPANPTEIQMLAEGQRQIDWQKIYSDVPLFMTDEVTQTAGDVVEYNGRKYRIKKINTYPGETDMPHTKAFALKVEQDNLGA